GKAVGLAFLLARDGRQLQSTQPKLALDPEKALATSNQARGGVEVDIARLDILDDLILVPMILQPKLVLVVELVVGVPVDIHSKLVADGSRDAEPEILLEIGIDLRGPSGYCHLLVAFPVVESRFDVRLTIHTEVNGGLSEDGGKRALLAAGYDDVEAEASAALTLTLTRALIHDVAPSVFQGRLQAVIAIVIVPETEWIADGYVADRLANHERLGRRIQRHIVLPVVAQAWVERAISASNRRSEATVRLPARQVEVGARREERVDRLCTIDLERSEEHTSELQSRENLLCRLLLEK